MVQSRFIVTLILLLLPILVVGSSEDKTICTVFDEDKADFYFIDPTEATQILNDDQYILSYKDVKYPKWALDKLNRSWQDEGRIYRYMENSSGEIVHMKSWEIKNIQFRSESWIKNNGEKIGRSFDETGALKNIYVKDKFSHHRTLFLTKEGVIESKYISYPNSLKSFSIEYDNDGIPYRTVHGGEVMLPCYE